MAGKSPHIRYAVDGETVRQCGLGGVFRRDVQLLDAGVPGGQGHGQHAGDAPQRPSEGQLPEKRRLRRRRRQLPGGCQDPHEDRQVVDRAGLFLPGRGQVHGDPADRELGPAVFHRRPDPLPGLPHGGVRQAHNVKGGQAAGEKALGTDRIPRDAVQPQGAHRHHHEKTTSKSVSAGIGCPPPEGPVANCRKVLFSQERVYHKMTK